MKIPVKEFRLVAVNNPHEAPQVEQHVDGLGAYYTVRVGREVISSHKTQALAENAARHVLGERAAHYVEPPKQSVPVKNPRRGRTLIYSDVIAIIGSKAGMKHNCDDKCKKSAHKYIHKFKPGSCIWGLPSGNVEIGK